MLKMNAQVISVIGATIAAGFLIAGAFLLSGNVNSEPPFDEGSLPEEFRAPDMQALPDELWASNANPEETILLQSDNIFREYTGDTQTGYGKWEAMFFFDDTGYGIGELVFTYAPEGATQKIFTIVEATNSTLTLLNTETNQETQYILALPSQY